MSRYGLAIGLLFIVSSTTVEGSIYEHFQFKKGPLTQSETWSGKILLTEDVVVQAHQTLTIKPDTWIVINHFDPKNRGNHPDRTELIIHGKLEVEDPDTLTILSTHSPEMADYLTTEPTTQLTLSPQPYDATELKDHLRGYRHQYAAVWALIFGIILVL